LWRRIGLLGNCGEKSARFDVGGLQLVSLGLLETGEELDRVNTAPRECDHDTGACESAVFPYAVGHKGWFAGSLAVVHPDRKQCKYHDADCKQACCLR
jgi:hypothetical protein